MRIRDGSMTRIVKLLLRLQRRIIELNLHSHWISSIPIFIPLYHLLMSLHRQAKNAFFNRFMVNDLR